MQSDLLIENQSFPAFRADVNNALQALGTNQSGVAAPTVTYPCLFWADTQTNLLKMRDTGNANWQTIGRLNQPWLGIAPDDIGALKASNNLSDLGSSTIARTNLGINDPSYNFAVNPNGAINQRAAASYAFGGLTTSQTVYAMDQWRFFCDPGSGGTSAAGTVLPVPIAPGSNEVPGEVSAIRVTNTTQGTALAANSYHLLSTPIENVAQFSSRNIIVSFYARSGIAGKTLGVYPQLQFGSGGSAQQPLTGQTVTLTAAYQRFFLTFPMPSIAGKTLGDGNYLQLNFVLQCAANAVGNGLPAIGWQGAATGALDITGLKVEFGTVATPYAPPIPVLEMDRCLRYFERAIVRYNFRGVTGSFFETPLFIRYKRTVPTIARAGETLTNCSFNSFQAVQNNLFSMLFNVTDGNTTSFYTGTLSISAEL